MALEQVTVTEKKSGTNRQFRGQHNGKTIVVAVGQIPEDWDEIEVYEDDQDGMLYCVARNGADIVAHRWTPNSNVQKIEKSVRGTDPLADVLPTLLGDFPADTPRDLGLPIP